MRAALQTLLALALSLPVGAHAQVGTRVAERIELPERPFVLLDSPRRYRANEPAQARLRVRGGGRVHVSVLRVDAPDALLAQAGRRQGVSVATLPIGAEAEALIAQRGAFPRRGSQLTLISHRAVRMPQPTGARAIANEYDVYESNEPVEEDVATRYVYAGGWATRTVELGRLTAGLYLVQVRAAAWVTSALVSVGELVLVARRGDAADVVRISDGEGRPLEGVELVAKGESAEVRATSDARGIARVAPSDDEVRRFVARRGEDLAWADVSHVRLTACDPRVYVATGRPVYRAGERVHVRGHVRGCDASGGRYVGLAGRAVSIDGGEGPVSAQTDADGNFVAVISASTGITATLDGREHRRVVALDSRALPRTSVIVQLDRPWAVSGELVGVTVSDVDGGWPAPATAVLETPGGRLSARVGPGEPARFLFRVPDDVRTGAELALLASVSVPGRVTFGRASLRVAPTRVQLELRASAERGESGRAFPVELRASDLGGAAAAGEARWWVTASDGNRARGATLTSGTSTLAAGRVSLAPTLRGEGPWLIHARLGRAQAELLVHARARPPTLGARGDLAVTVRTERARVGEPVELLVRAPRRGSTWLTLERGGVLLERHLTRGGRVTLPAPEASRGLSTLVLTHVHGGRVELVTRALEVETSRAMTLALRTDRPVFAKAGRAQVHLEARDDAGEPRDAVISLWVADAGYWDLGEEHYPDPGAYLRLPGRPASAGDSSAPVAFGAEEGRRLETRLIWDGDAAPEASHRHGWGYGGQVVSVRASGSLAAVFGRLAAAAGFSGSRVTCPDDTARHTLDAQNLPWDLVVERVANLAEGSLFVERDTLRLDCVGGNGGMAGAGGLGLHGRGHGAGGLGMRGSGVREERLEGTTHFVGLARLGPDGELDLEVPLPDHVGRWRIEALAIADDGGGGRAHAVVDTRDAIEAWVDVPRELSVGDRVAGTLRLQSHVGASEAEVALHLEPALALAEPLPASVSLDANGRASLPFTLVARSATADAGVVASARAGVASDDVHVALRVRPSHQQRQLRYGALVAEGATEVDVPLPALAAPADLVVTLDPSVEREARRILDDLSEPRWDLAISRVDRLLSLAALGRAVAGAPSSAPLAARIRGAMTAELAALQGMRSTTGELGWGDHPLTALTLRMLVELSEAERGSWTDALTQIRARLERAELSGGARARAAGLLLTGRAAEQELRGALARSQTLDDHIAALWAAERIGASAALQRAASQALEAWLEARLTDPRPPAACGGAAWFTCFALDGERGALARGVLALTAHGHPGAASLRSRVGAWIAARGAARIDGPWGSAEADVLELFARSAGGRDRPQAFLDGRRLRTVGGRLVVPEGEHRLTLRFATRTGRLRRVLVHGDARVEPPATTQGNTQLERRVHQVDGAWRLTVSYSLPRRASGLELVVPLPAAVSPDLRAVPGDARVSAGEVHLSFGARDAGRHTVEIPLLVTTVGETTVAPAALRSLDGELVGVTPVQRVIVGPRPSAVEAP